jgi:hypothetical protein
MPPSGNDVEHRIGRALAGESDGAALQVEPASGKIIGAADQLGAPGQPRLGHRSPDVERGAPFAADAQPADRQPVVRAQPQLQPPRLGPAHRDKLVLVAAGFANGQPGHLRRGRCAAELEAAADQLEVARNFPRAAGSADAQRPAHLRLDVVAVDQLRRARIDRQVHAQAARCRQVESATSRNEAAALGGAREPVDHQLRAAEPAIGGKVLDHRPGDGAFQPRAFGAQGSRGSAGRSAFRAHRRRPPPARSGR